jgi:hypothetical protein
LQNRQGPLFSDAVIAVIGAKKYMREIYCFLRLKEGGIILIEIF